MRTQHDRLRIPWWVRTAALLLSMMALAACAEMPTTLISTTQGHKTCDALQFDEVHRHLTHAWSTRQELVTWIRTTFGVSERDLRFVPEGAQTRWGTADSYSWPAAETYWQVLVHGTQLVSFNAGWATDQPSVQDALQCLGKPSSYIADYREQFESVGPIVLVNAFYPDTGTMLAFSVSTSADASGDPGTERQSLSFDVDHTVVERIYVSEPVYDDVALVDQLMGDSFGIGPSWASNNTREWLFSMLRPWPDDVRDLEFEKVPGP